MGAVLSHFSAAAPCRGADLGFAARMTFNATVLTLYPEMFPGSLGLSLAGRGLAEGKWSIDAVHIRDFAKDKHRTVDDTPAGGRAGMVLKVDILAAAIDHARSINPDAPIIAMTPRGKPISQARVRARSRTVPVSSSCAEGSRVSTSGSSKAGRSRRCPSATRCFPG